jgi:hypothetical protein
VSPRGCDRLSGRGCPFVRRGAPECAPSAVSEGSEATPRDLASLPGPRRPIRGGLCRHVSTVGDPFHPRNSAGIFAHRQGASDSSVRRRRRRGCGRGQLTLRLIGELPTGADLAVDLGLVSPPPGFLATGRGLLAVEVTRGTVERSSRPPSRLVAQPYSGAGTTRRGEPLVALVGKPLALIRIVLTGVGKPLAFICDFFALRCEPVALVGQTIPLVCTTLSPGELSPRLIDADNL